MGFTAKAAKNCKERWGMGLLLVFFAEDNNSNDGGPASAAISVDKNGNSNKLFSSSSSSSMVNGNAIRRSNSNRLLTKAQSTISICALLVFVTLLLFTLSTFEPNARSSGSNSRPVVVNSRRFLSRTRNPNPISSPDSAFLSSPWLSGAWGRNAGSTKSKADSRPRKALQGLGVLYRRGTKAMADLLVGHVSEDTSDDELRFFLRALHRSGLTARSDVVLVFASSSSSSEFDSLIREENESFLKLVQNYRKLNKTTSSSKRASSGFDVTQFKASKKETGEPLWGKKGLNGKFIGNDSDESTRMSYGSVVGFEASELDPENSLAGFLSDHVPMSLRRWACYPMLLGRVRRNFKHITLVDAKSVVVLWDQPGWARSRSPESVHFFAGAGHRHGRRGSDKTQPHCGVNPAVITGGARGVRRLAGAMLTEIVRAATAAAASGQHKRKGGGAVAEAGILNQLVGNEFLLKNVKLVKSGDSVPDAGELGRNSANTSSFSKHAVVHRGNSNGHEVIKSVIMKQICSSEIDSSVYSECQQKS